MGKTGSFDLNFPGARMICDSPQKRESLLKYINGDADSYEVKLSYKDFKQDVDNAIYNTTYIHEAKHFHDHLLCPYLLHNYTLKINSLYNSLIAAYLWMNGDKPYRWIPIPFCDWLNLSFKEQIRLIEKKGISPSDIPIVSFEKVRLLSFKKTKCDNKFENKLLLGAANYWEYKLNNRDFVPEGFVKGYNLKNFCESMAFNQQLYYIVNKYGDYGCRISSQLIEDNWKIFDSSGRLKTLKEKAEPNDRTEFSTYMAPFWLVGELARKKEVIHTHDFQSYFLFWTLCGPLANNELSAIEPLNRILNLISLDKRKKILNIDKEAVLNELFLNPIKTFMRWNRYINTHHSKSLKKCPIILRALNIEPPFPKTFNDFYDSHIKMFVGISHHLESLGLFGPAFYIYKYARTLDRVSKLFCKVPYGYLSPDSYCQNYRLFSNVPFRFEFENVNPIRKNECHNENRIRENGIAFMNDTIYGDGFNSYSQAEIVDWLAYEAYSKVINFSDALFGHSKVNMPGALIKEFLPGIKPWFFKNSNS